MRKPAFALIVVFFTACGGGGGGSDDPPATGGGGGGGGGGGDSTFAGSIKVLSNRADLISGDDALVEVTLPTGVTASALTMTLNGQDVTPDFGQRPNNRYMGLLTGLEIGSNVLTVRAADGSSASTTIRNYPNGGPIFSGPHIQPWACQQGALDALCNQPAEYSLLYKSTDPTQTGLQPYDPANPPSDVADTTTENGTTLPFIVQLERGYQDRDEYRILTLFQPGQPWLPWAPQPQWNHKVLVTHGGGCGNARGAGSAPLDDYSGTFPPNPAFEQSYVTALGRGFAVMSTALDNLGHNCNVVVAAESLMMAKERLIEQYGEIRYTIGTGCSGGSITQAMVSNAYPGVYQGNITACAYPDVFSTGAQFADLHLLRLYFEPGQDGSLPPWAPGVVWTPTQMAAVEGHITHLNAITTDELFFKAATAPTGNCAGADSYDPDTNPGGVRCGLLDYIVNLLGPRAPEVWSPMEQAAGRGFAGNPLDNVGIQYGLTPLRQGLITPAQFVDLNAKIGGLTIDIEHKAERTLADQPALANAYRSGELNSANNLHNVAIINAVGADPGAAHDTVHAFWVRWRLDREHGNHDNHVMWSGPAPLIGDVNYMNQALLAMDRWLAAVEADARNIPLPQKLTENKPADVHDQCSDGAGHKIADDICIEVIEPAIAYGSPRSVATAPRADDNLKCTLKPFSRDDDYGLVPFTEDQWTQLEQVFADGVCDYSVAGVDQQGAIPWLTYQNAAGAVIYGGAPLPAPPPNSGGGWASPSFLGAP